eukprot:1140879-Pelagomonas_calceolata.AAC.5
MVNTPLTGLGCTHAHSHPHARAARCAAHRQALDCYLLPCLRPLQPPSASAAGAGGGVGADRTASVGVAGAGAAAGAPRRRASGAAVAPAAAPGPGKWRALLLEADQGHPVDPARRHRQAWGRKCELGR